MRSHIHFQAHRIERKCAQFPIVWQRRRRQRWRWLLGKWMSNPVGITNKMLLTCKQNNLLTIHFLVAFVETLFSSYFLFHFADFGDECHHNAMLNKFISHMNTIQLVQAEWYCVGRTTKRQQQQQQHGSERKVPVNDFRINSFVRSFILKFQLFLWICVALIIIHVIKMLMWFNANTFCVLGGEEKKTHYSFYRPNIFFLSNSIVLNDVHDFFHPIDTIWPKFESSKFVTTPDLLLNPNFFWFC